MTGYPSEEALNYIKGFEVKISEKENNLTELFEFIKSWWEYKDWGWDEHREQEEYRNGKVTVNVYEISTAGWSGNEDIIMALKENYLAWSLSWYQSTTGGHYIFKVKVPQ